MSFDDTAYYRQRSITERVRAKTASSQEVAEIHEELARLYDAMVAHKSLRPKLRISFPTAA